jgi:methylmalonyl-CoA mutase, N-terminal domain
MTDELETAAVALMNRVAEFGSAVAAIEAGFQKNEIETAAYRTAREIESGERVVVGVNRYVEEEPARVAIHQHAEEVAAERRTSLDALRAGRDPAAVARALGALRGAALGEVNLMPVLVEAVKTYATIGEIAEVLRDVFGEYRAVQAY